MATESKYMQRDGLDYAKVTKAAGSSIKPEAAVEEFRTLELA